MNDRIDLFTLIHKGLRWWMGEVSAGLGATNFRDKEQMEDALNELQACLSALDEHSVHEDGFIAPVLDARSPARTAGWHEEHAQLEQAAAALRAQARELDALGVDHPRIEALGLQLYRSFALFVSGMSMHLDDEETKVMPLLWSVCTDEELSGIMTAFRERHGSSSALLYAKLAPAFNETERALLRV